MRESDNQAIYGILDDPDGNPYGRTAETGWWAAERVELKASNLLIWWYPQSGKQRLKLVSPPKRLLEKFLSLAEASDKQIQQFVIRYGSIGVFEHGGQMALGDIRARPKVAFCEVYRYFARVMQALLLLASRLHDGQCGALTGWASIGSYPKIMERVTNRRALGKYARVDAEKNWLSIAEIYRDSLDVLKRDHEKGIDREKGGLGATLDYLLDLAGARIRFKWRSVEQTNPKPHLYYENQVLFQYLIHQLCLSVARVPASAVCSSCNTQYSPLQRVPKKGQRNFCLQCRKDGIPQKLALKRFREKQRESRGGPVAPSA